MRTQINRNFNQTNYYPISTAKGVPLNSRLTDVKHINMVFKKKHIEVQLYVERLYGGNYKLEVINNDLVLTALRYVKDYSRNRYKWVTSTYFLPYYICGKEFKSELKEDILHIYIPKKEEFVN